MLVGHTCRNIYNEKIEWKAMFLLRYADAQFQKKTFTLFDTYIVHHHSPGSTH